MQTPSKRAKHAHPLHSQPINVFASRALHPALLDPYDPPTSTLLSPSRARISLGPTPQKDGKVLGLFDILSSGSIDRTPSKRKILDPVAGNAQQTTVTPSKQFAAGCESQKLPGSASKGAGLSILFTPASHRVTKAKPGSTPLSATAIRRLNFDETPAFLRRDSQRAATAATSVASHGDEDGEGEAVSWSPIVPRRISKLHRPPAAGRGLSALVRGLRDMEEERLDEDLDLLREMEGSGPFESFARKMSNQMKTVQKPHIFVGDSQAPDMPLGPDGAVESEEEVENEEGKNKDGRPLKVWKKKGQKRTTRAVKMRPTTAKWKPEPEWKVGAESAEEVEAEEEMVAETQLISGAVGAAEATKPPSADDDEYAVDPEEDEDTALDELDTRTADLRGRKNGEKQANADGKREGLVQKVKKKISATAHANFRALKLRNKNSKAKGGNSRFRKRR